MLSNEYTLDEVKAELKTYDAYGYDNETDFNNELSRQADLVYYEILIFHLDDIYAEIQQKSVDSSDREDFLDTIEDYERYLYFAEVYFICNGFLKLINNNEAQSNIGGGNSYSVEGFSESGMSSGKSNSGLGLISKKYYDKARTYMLKAGYDDFRYRLERG